MIEHTFGISLVVYCVIGVCTYLCRAFFKVESIKTTTGFAIFWPVMLWLYLGICFVNAVEEIK